MKKRYYSFVFFICFASCIFYKEKDCKDLRNQMILGNWVNVEDKKFLMIITSDSIFYYYEDDFEGKKVKIINNLKDCHDSLSPYPPSKVKIIEINKNNDSLINHVLYINSLNMEWASGNHSVQWKKQK